ncbi:GlcG/HbpS family heme-binding protein [Xanthobacter sp. ZOL 2024]
MTASAADLSLDQAQVLIAAALAHGRAQAMNPLAICVLDVRGALKAFAAEDGSSLKRGEIARGKADGALALGIGSRSLFKRAKDQPFFISAAASAIGGSLVPVPGGVLVRDGAGQIIGVVGVSGDTSDNDEACAIAGIVAAGFTADPGVD